MKYDFTTVIDRTEAGSVKWNLMNARKQNVPAGTIPFTVADMEFLNAPEIGESIKRYVDSHVLGYSEPTDEYYSAVTGWMKRLHGLDVDKESIVVYPGVVPALYHLVRTFCQKGDGVIIMPPIYPPFFGSAESFGCEELLCPLINENEHYTIDFDLLEKLCRKENAKLLAFCSPHNPVGRVWTEEELYKLAKICTDNGVLIVSDEIHSDIIMPGFRHVSMGALKGFEDNTILCTAPSKTFNLASMQTCNIMIKNPELRNKFLATKDYMMVETLNALGFVACAAAYNQCEGWMREMISVVNENFNYMKSFIDKNIPALKTAPMEGTYLAWVNCRGLNLSPDELEALLVENNIFVNSGSMFGPEGDGYIRIDIACPKSVIEDLMEKLLQAL